MDNLETIQKFFEGLIEYFFDPCQSDESHEEVLCLIRNSKKNKRLRREIIPQDIMLNLCSSGWDFKDYASAIRKAAEEWEEKMACSYQNEIDSAND